MFLGAASQRTERIRLGHGIVQLPTNHPARVAERISTLDLISHGRVEFGVGEGSSVTELHPFDRRFRDKRAVWEDAMRCLMPMFWEEGWEYHGEYFDFPLRNVVPKPAAAPASAAVGRVQPARHDRDGRTAGDRRPRVPVRVGGGGPRVGARLLQRVHQSATSCSARTRPTRTSPSSASSCARDTDEEARARADGSTFFQFALRFYNEHGPVVPGTVSLWDEYQTWKAGPAGQKAQHGGLIGSPATIREKLHRFAASNVDQVILLNQAGRNRHEHICAALELFAAEVMPEFHALEPEHDEWKRRVLSGELELEEIDTEPYNFISPASPKWKPGMPVPVPE